MNTGSKMTILLVEDQAIIAMSEANMLKKNGYEVLVSNSGEHAVNTVQNHTEINLILMDIDLGKGIDGTEAAQQILKNYDIPIIFLSNHTEKEVVEKTEKITSYGYVVKNSGETVLIASIKMAFKLFEAHQQVLESEIKLLESDRKFHTLEKQIDDVIWTMDMNFQFTYISPSVEKMLGYTVEEISQMSLQDYLTPESAQLAINLLAEEINGFLNQKREGTIVTAIIDQIKKDKTILSCEIKARFLLDMHNNPIGIIGVTRDISERQKSNEALIESKRALDLALEGAQIGFWDSNYITGKVYRSNIWASMLGYTIDEVDSTPQFWRNHIHPDDVDRVFEEVEKHEEGKLKSFSIEHRMRTKSGNYKWILDWGKVFERSEDGKPLRAMGVHIDIDDRIKSDKALIESESRFRTLFETMTLGILYQDEAGKVIAANPAAKKLLGLTTEQLHGRSDLDTGWKIIHEDGTDFPIETHPGYKALKTGKVVKDVIMGIQYSNKHNFVWINVIAVPQFSEEQKQPSGVYVTFEDITQRKLFQDNLKKSQQMLQNVLEQFPGVVFWKDKESVYLGCNQAFASGAGLKTPEQIVGKTDFDLPWAKIEAELYRNDDKQVIETAKPKLNIEETQHQSGNEIKWFNTNKVPLIDSLGNIIGILGTSNDITERKKVEEELRENENKLRSIIKVSPIGIGVTVNRVLIEVNEYICNILGYSKNELLDKSARMLYPSDAEFEFVGAEKYKQIEKTGIGTVETKWKRKDGKIIDILLSSTPLNLKDISGGVTFTALDITNRKRDDALIKESEANLIAVINHREEAIWSVDKDYNYIIVNDVFKSDYKIAFGVDLKKGINAIEILSGELLEFWKAKYDKALNGEVVKFEFSQNVQNRLRSFEMTLSPIISDTKVLGVSGISRDITLKKEMDEEILQRKKELERFEKIVIGRELKMIELKEKIIEYETKLKELEKHG